MEPKPNLPLLSLWSLQVLLLVEHEYVVTTNGKIKLSIREMWAISEKIKIIIQAAYRVDRLFFFYVKPLKLWNLDYNIWRQ